MLGLTQVWTALREQTSLRSIHDADDLNQVCALANTLADTVGENEDHPLYSLYEIALDLIEQWEDKHVSIPTAPPREVLRHLLETNNLKQKDLIDIASPTLVSDILGDRREISKRLAKSLAERFRVDIAAFI